MDITRLYQDFSVDTAPPEHKHSRPGWVNTECPFCKDLPGSNPGYHLGWNLNEEYFFCWRCGWKPPIKAVTEVLNVDKKQAEHLLKQYDVNHTIIKKLPKHKKDFKLPSGLSEGLNTPAKKYLTKRKFNIDQIEKDWGIKSTGPISTLDKIDYRFRIWIPYFWNGQLVSFDTRDYTEKTDERYKACPKEREIIEHKHILYGNQEHWTDVDIIVEGPTDVWSLGKRACAVSGIQYTIQQVRLMAKIFKRAWIIFDPQAQAQRQAIKLMAELKFRGVETDNILLDAGKDPGSLTDKEAKELVDRLLI
ncbi:MAG: hypothetical protein ACOC2U_03560 [bacterium]